MIKMIMYKKNCTNGCGGGESNEKLCLKSMLKKPHNFSLGSDS